MMDLERMFNARSVVIVGASSNPEKTGYTILKNVLDGGFEGAVYPINPRGGEILGLQVYRSISELPGPVDLVVLVVPAEAVPDVMDEAGRVGAGAAVVISGGFGEVGKTELEKSLAETAARHGVRVLGPNCQGFNYTPNKLCVSWPLVTAKGSFAIISQSGTVGAELELLAAKDGIGVSAFVALGNKSDIDETELIKFFEGDKCTKVIALYLERIKDGGRFLEVVQKTEKPIVILKGGRTDAGKKAAESHTRSIAGSHRVFEGVSRQYGFVRATDLTELYDYAKAASLLPRHSGKNLMIVTSSGGSGILAVDAAQDAGMKLASLSEGSKAKLGAVLPGYAVKGNPLDLTGDATAERYEKAVLALAEDPGIDLLLVIFGDPIPEAAEVIGRLREKIRQPMAVAYLGGGAVAEAESLQISRLGVPVYPTPERAVKSLASLYRVEKILSEVV